MKAKSLDSSSHRKSCAIYTQHVPCYLPGGNFFNVHQTPQKNKLGALEIQAILKIGVPVYFDVSCLFNNLKSHLIYKFILLLQKYLRSRFHLWST